MNKNILFKRIALVAGLWLVIATTSVAQNNVGIGTTTPDPSALLDLSSKVQGTLITRMNTGEMNTIAAPAVGLLIFNTDSTKFCYYDGGQWLCGLGAGGQCNCPPGADGPTGPAGPQGATGDPGPAGQNGLNGAAGPAGPAGPQGIQGPDGPTGVAGPAGAQGPTGVQGNTGPAGPAGANGATGPAGPGGPTGPAGAQGPAGANGANGATGPTGPSGGAVMASAIGTTDQQVVANIGWQNMPDMTVNFTPTSGTATVSFSAAGTFTGTYTAGQFCMFRVLVNGTPLMGHGTYCTVGAFDGYFGEAHNTWGTALEVPINVTPNVNNTVTVQWNFQSLFTNTLINYVGTQESANRALIIR